MGSNGNKTSSERGRTSCEVVEGYKEEDDDVELAKKQADHRTMSRDIFRRRAGGVTQNHRESRRSYRKTIQRLILRLSAEAAATQDNDELAA